MNGVPFLSLLILLPQRGEWAATIPWVGEGDKDCAERTPPKQKGGAKPSLRLPSTFPECGMWHRPQKSRSDRPSLTLASFLPPIPGLWGVSV